MKPEIAYIAATIIAAITVLGLAFLIYKKTTESRASYEALTKACIDNGGTWVPLGTSRRGLCIGGHQ